MTHTSTEQPEALRLADIVERLNVGVHSQAIAEEYSAAARELRRLHARVQEMEAKVETGKRLLREEMERANRYAGAAQAQRVPLSDEQIEALPVWDNFVGLFTSTRLEIARAIIKATHGITQEKQG